MYMSYFIRLLYFLYEMFASAAEPGEAIQQSVATHF